MKSESDRSFERMNRLSGYFKREVLNGPEAPRKPRISQGIHEDSALRGSRGLAKVQMGAHSHHSYRMLAVG